MEQHLVSVKTYFEDGRLIHEQFLGSWDSVIKIGIRVVDGVTRLYVSGCPDSIIVSEVNPVNLVIRT
jgi:hypothetical protein